MNKGGCKIIVLVGIPSSGKSSFARQFIRNRKNWVIVSRDEIRAGRGDYWIPEQEDWITEVEDFQVISAIKNGLNVIIDATNLNPKTQEKWKRIAGELDCEIEFKLFEISYQEALKRDKERGEKGERAVGEKVLKRFFRKYFPDEFNKQSGKIDNRLIKAPSDDLPRCVICDLDGTLSLNITGRSPYDGTRVEEDLCDPRLKQLLQVIENGYWRRDDRQALSSPRLIFFSGREGTIGCFNRTVSWLTTNLGHQQ